MRSRAAELGHLQSPQQLQWPRVPSRSRCRHGCARRRPGAPPLLRLSRRLFAFVFAAAWSAPLRPRRQGASQLSPVCGCGLNGCGQGGQVVVVGVGGSNVNHLATGQSARPRACCSAPAGTELEGGGGARRTAFPAPRLTPFSWLHEWLPLVVDVPRAHVPRRGLFQRPVCCGNERPLRSAAAIPFGVARVGVGAGGAGGVPAGPLGSVPHARRAASPPRLPGTTPSVPWLASLDKRARSCRLIVVDHLSRLACVRGRRGHRQGPRSPRQEEELGSAPTGGCRLGPSGPPSPGTSRPAGLVDAARAPPPSRDAARHPLPAADRRPLHTWRWQPRSRTVCLPRLVPGGGGVAELPWSARLSRPTAVRAEWALVPDLPLPGRWRPRA